MSDLEGRNYDISVIEEDDRLKRCRNECIGVEIWGVELLSFHCLYATLDLYLQRIFPISGAILPGM